MANGTLRVAVIGFSGSGKSTCARFIEAFAATQGLSSARVKLAEPLYGLQQHVYATARTALRGGDQDQILMESLAGHLRRINPCSLVEDFESRLAGVDAQVVINDDLRDPHVDALRLAQVGFRILRVKCDESIRLQRLALRGDRTRADGSTSGLDLIRPDAVVRNDNDLFTYEKEIFDIMRSWR